MPQRTARRALGAEDPPCLSRSMCSGAEPLMRRDANLGCWQPALGLLVACVCPPAWSARWGGVEAVGAGVMQAGEVPERRVARVALVPCVSDGAGCGWVSGLIGDKALLAAVCSWCSWCLCVPMAPSPG